MIFENETLQKAYDGSYYTIVGAGGDLQEWKDFYSKALEEQGIGSISVWIDFTGKKVNDELGLTGDNRYDDNLHFLAFSLDGLDVAKLALFKLRMGDRWFDDIVNNDLWREADNRKSYKHQKEGSK